MADWAILGCGYVGTRLARALCAAGGNRVRVCARNATRLEPLRDLGAEVYALDATKSRAFGPALYGLQSPVVVYSIPPLPSGEPLRRAADAAAAVGASRFIYLSSTAVYGETPDGETVDEQSAVAISDPEAMTRIAEESSVDLARLSGLSTVILRLSAIYGPGRGVRERLKARSYKLVDDGAHWFSRVHVDDIVGILCAAAERAPTGAVYCVADDRPSTQREYADWLVARLGVPAPPSVPSLAPGAPRRGVRNRRVANGLVKRELGYSFRYPSYVEGEQAIEREAATPDAAPAPALVPVIVAAAPRSTEPLRQLADRLAEAIALLDGGDAKTARATIERAQALIPGIEGEEKKGKN